MTRREDLKLKPASLKSGSRNDCTDISKMELDGVELAGTWFTNVNFNFQNLKGSSLRGATFENCSFHYASFGDTNMAGANFINCDFQNVGSFESCDFRGAALIGCKMRTMVSFHRVRMQGVWFEVEQCPDSFHLGWDFEASDLSGACFHLGDSRGTIKIRSSWLFGTRFTGGENKFFTECGSNFVEGFQGLNGQQRRSVKKRRLYLSPQST